MTLGIEGKARVFNTDPHKSTTFCGCDPGAHYECERHRHDRHAEEMQRAVVVSAKDFTPMPCQSNIVGIGIGGAPTRATTLPTAGVERKKYPVASGVLDYFPDALVAVSHVSFQGNEQHNPDQPLHWARGKSADESDTMMRHFLQRGTMDTDGVRHSAKMVWRALAILQKEIEGESR